MFRKKIIYLFLLVLLAFGAYMLYSKSQGQDKIRIVFGGGFGGGLDPTSFKTVHGAYVSDLVYPPLVGTLDIKQYYPRIVKSWHINDSETILSMQLKSDLTFSNGDNLQCADIKKSIESSLAVRKKSNNVKVDFKLLQGFDIKKDIISGINCKSPMEIEFYSVRSNPNLLEALSHPEMGIYKKLPHSLIGCGNYIIENQEKDYVLLSKTENKTIDLNFPKFIEYVGSDTHGTDNADVFVGYSPKYIPRKYKKLKKFELTWMALVLHLYRHEHSLFSKEENRKALLALMRHDENFNNLAHKLGNNNFIPDPQPFLKFQLGRLDDSIADRIIFSGTQWIPNLLEDSKKNPIKFVHAGSPQCLKVLEHLESLGLAVDEKGLKELSFNDLDFEPADIQCVSFSAALIRKDMIRYSSSDALSPPFEELLSVQTGKNNMSKSDLKEYLEKVNQVTLEKIPFIKIGHTPVVAYFNDKKVAVRQITHTSRANSLLDRFFLVKRF